MAHTEQLARAASVAAGAIFAIAVAMRVFPATAHAMATNCTLRFVSRLLILYALLYMIAAACMYAVCAFRVRRHARAPFRFATDDVPCADVETGTRGGEHPHARGVEHPDGGVAVGYSDPVLK